MVNTLHIPLRIGFVASSDGSALRQHCIQLNHFTLTCQYSLIMPERMCRSAGDHIGEEPATDVLAAQIWFQFRLPPKFHSR